MFLAECTHKYASHPLDSNAFTHAEPCALSWSLHSMESMEPTHFLTSPQQARPLWTLALDMGSPARGFFYSVPNN